MPNKHYVNLYCEKLNFNSFKFYGFDENYFNREYKKKVMNKSKGCRKERVHLISFQKMRVILNYLSMQSNEASSERHSFPTLYRYGFFVFLLSFY